VQARSHQRAAKSDWMELEQARGISITSTALQFDYEGVRVNLLDTPGHQDFSKTPTAPSWRWIARSWCSTALRALSLRRKKLFAVCRKRKHPDHDLYQ